MEWNLFLDDERIPPKNENWYIARNVDQAINQIMSRGLPAFISFDHDLGENEETGYDFVKWLIEYHIYYDIKPTFRYHIHSQNPIGSENIRSYIENYKRVCGIENA